MTPLLCRTCLFGVVAEGLGKRVAFCQRINQNINIHVVTCSGYTKADAPFDRARLVGLNEPPKEPKNEQ